MAPGIDPPSAATLQVYQQMMSDNATAVAFLFSQDFTMALQITATRVATEFQVTKEIAIEELRRLLAIKVLTTDINATKISPTPLMDELWHDVILDTQFYAVLQNALGIILHHRPSGASEAEAGERLKRLNAMKGIYRAFFLAEPFGDTSTQTVRLPSQSKELDNFPISITMLKGKSIRVLVSMKTTMYRLMAGIKGHEGVPVEPFRLLYDGRRLDRLSTMEDNGIQAYDTFELYPEQRGC